MVFYLLDLYLSISISLYLIILSLLSTRGTFSFFENTFILTPTERKLVINEINSLSTFSI